MDKAHDPVKKIEFYRPRVLRPGDERDEPGAAPGTVRIMVFTWIGAAIFIAEAIASGVIGHLGANAWSDLQGEWDLRDLFNASTAEFQRMLKAQFDLHEINTGIDHMTGAADWLRAYQTSPAEFRLNNAEAEARAAITIFTSERHRAVAFGNFFIAGGLLLAILQERLRAFPSRSEVELIRSTVNSEAGFPRYIAAGEERSQAHIRDLFWGFFLRTEGRPLATESFVPGWYVGRPGEYHYGNRVWVGRPPQNYTESQARARAEQDGRQLMQTFVDSEINSLFENVINPGREVYRLWQQMAANARVH